MLPLFFVLACSPPLRGVGTARPSVSTGDADADTDADSDTDTDSDGDTDADTFEKPDFDCSAPLAAPPYASREIDGSASSEDIDIDVHGYIIGSDRANLYRSSVHGDLILIAPDVENPQAIVALPTEDIVLFEESVAKLVRIDPDGNRTTLGTPPYVPYGDATASGIIYATQPNWDGTDSFIIRIDPFANQIDQVLVWPEHQPWGITFNEDYSALYVSTLDAVPGGAGPRLPYIYRLNVDDQGGVDDPELFATLDEDRIIEGLTVDGCGNLYVSRGTSIVRVSRDGKQIDEIWREEVGPVGRAISGLAFGRAGGAGGTDPRKLYASNPYGKFAIEIDVGVPGGSAW